MDKQRKEAKLILEEAINDAENYLEIYQNQILFSVSHQSFFSYSPQLLSLDFENELSWNYLTDVRADLLKDGELLQNIGTIQAAVLSQKDNLSEGNIDKLLTLRLFKDSHISNSSLSKEDKLTLIIQLYLREHLLYWGGDYYGERDQSSPNWNGFKKEIFSSFDYLLNAIKYYAATELIYKVVTPFLLGILKSHTRESRIQNYVLGEEVFEWDMIHIMFQWQMRPHKLSVGTRDTLSLYWRKSCSLLLQEKLLLEIENNLKLAPQLLDICIKNYLTETSVSIQELEEQFIELKQLSIKNRFGHFTTPFEQIVDSLLEESIKQELFHHKNRETLESILTVQKYYPAGFFYYFQIQEKHSFKALKDNSHFIACLQGYEALFKKIYTIASDSKAYNNVVNILIKYSLISRSKPKLPDQKGVIPLSYIAVNTYISSLLSIQ